MTDIEHSKLKGNGKKYSIENSLPVMAIFLKVNA